MWRGRWRPAVGGGLALALLAAAGAGGWPRLYRPPDPVGEAAAAEEEEKKGPPAKKEEKQKEPPPEKPYGPGHAVADAFADALAIAAADEARGGQPDAPFQRYFWVASPRKHVDDFLIAFCVHVNLLSTEGVVKWPVQVAPRLLRIDVRDYGWDRADKLLTFEKTADVDVYFHQRAKLLKDTPLKEHWPSRTKKPPREKKAGETVAVPAAWLPQQAIDGLRELLYTESPVLMAEWFFVQSARQVSLRNVQEGIGYYDFLGLKTRDDFFALTGTDPAVAHRVFAEWRAVVVKSGISQQNRQVVGFGAHSRRVWGTLDTFTQQGAGVARRNLRDGEFAHNAEEWYGFLGNGLWITFLSNNKGDAAESAPDKIGPDDSTLNVARDHRVHANLSCVRCHGADKEMLKPVDDWARKTFRKGGVLRLADGDKRVILELESLYLRELTELLDDDRVLYSRGIARATASAKHPKGLTSAAVGKLYAEAWSRYADGELAPADAARELGLSEDLLLAGVKKHASAPNRGATDLVLGSFLDAPPQSMPRLDWEDSYALAQTLALQLQPPEQLKKVPAKDALTEEKKDRKEGKK